MPHASMEPYQSATELPALLETLHRQTRAIAARKQCGSFNNLDQDEIRQLLHTAVNHRERADRRQRRRRSATASSSASSSASPTESVGEQSRNAKAAAEEKLRLAFRRRDWAAVSLMWHGAGTAVEPSRGPATPEDWLCEAMTYCTSEDIHAY